MRFLVFLAACSSTDLPIGEAPIATTAKLLRVQKPIAGEYIVVRDRAERVRATEAEAIAISKQPDVRYVEENQAVQLSAIPWNVDRVDQAARPLDGKLDTGALHGEGVYVHVFDTGIRRTHEQFEGRVHEGFSPLDGNPGATDCHGHGTHVSGTIAGKTYGVAKKATIVPVRILDCRGQGDVAGVVAGLQWLRDNGLRPAVVNMSIGGDFSQALNDAVEETVKAGIAVVVAAGNDATDACDYSPSSARAAITVGASGQDDRRIWWSNQGPCVDVHAPGVDVVSAIDESDTATYEMDGTSMATPHVTAAAALYLSAHPDAGAEEVAAALYQSATPNIVGNWFQRGTTRSLLNVSFARDGAPVPDAGVQHEEDLPAKASIGHNFSRAPLSVLPGTPLRVRLLTKDSSVLLVRFGEPVGDWPNESYDCVIKESDGEQLCETTVPAGERLVFISVRSHGNTSGTLSAKWTSASL